jgi:hypothetical protein
MQPKQINDVIDLSCNEELTFVDTISSSIRDRDFRTPSPNPDDHFNLITKKFRQKMLNQPSTKTLVNLSTNLSSSVVNPSSSPVIQAQRNSKSPSHGI